MGLCTMFTRPSSLACVYHVPRTEGLGTRLSGNLTILAIDIAAISLLYIRTQSLLNLTIPIPTFPGKQRVGWKWQWHDRRHCELVPSPSHQEAPQPIPCPILERDKSYQQSLYTMKPHTQWLLNQTVYSVNMSGHHLIGHLVQDIPMK